MSTIGNYTPPEFGEFVKNTHAKGVMFIPEMVRAILRGDKTQTRRVSKPQPVEVEHGMQFPKGLKLKNGRLLFAGTQTPTTDAPLGSIGDRIYVRETFRELIDCRTGEFSSYAYYADYPEKFHKDYPAKWKPSIHMPKKAARIFLEITRVRLERLNDITQEDAQAEGVARDQEWFKSPDLIAPEMMWRAYGKKDAMCDTARASFRMLWESLAGSGSWDDNPYVWVYDFKRVDGIEYKELHGMFVKQPVKLKGDLFDRIKDATEKGVNVTREELSAIEGGLMEYIIHRLSEAESECLGKVFVQCLGREFTEHDAPRFRTITHPDYSDSYGIEFDGSPVGMIHRDFGNNLFSFDPKDLQQPSFKVSFVPGGIHFPYKPGQED